MKLIRYGKSGQEKPGLILSNNKWIDVSGFGEDYNEHFFGSAGLTRLKEWLNNHVQDTEKDESAANNQDNVQRRKPSV